ncbi:MAG: HAD family phosphatase [Prevotella sp.]|nr:HAD family phosphatase [Prevotella sp.]
MIKNIIFDLGGVIVTIDQAEALRRLKELGLDAAEDYLNPYTQNGIFGDLEEGKISDDEFRVELGKLVGREMTFDDCRYFWLGYRKDLPKRNLAMLRKLRADGYRLILLSNTNQFMMSWGLSGDFDGNGLSLEDYFDALYLSFRLKTMKPSPLFFEKVLESEKILPEESLFVDDGKRNVEIAESLGFHTLCPVNGSDWTGDLLALLDKLNH